MTAGQAAAALAAYELARERQNARSAVRLVPRTAPRFPDAWELIAAELDDSE